MTDEQPPIETVDLLARAGIGPLWGIASTDLNATLLAWPARHVVAEHVNAELDVLVVVLGGTGRATVDDDAGHPVGQRAADPARGAQMHPGGRRGPAYVSVHRRRGPLQIAPPPQD